MITEAEFQKASQALRSNSKDIASKYTVVCYYLEQKKLAEARSYLGEIIGELNLAQEIALFAALQAEITRCYNVAQNGYYHHSSFTSEDLCHLISLLQKLHARGAKGADAWLLPKGSAHASLLKWIVRDHKAYCKFGEMFYSGQFNVPKDLEYALTCFMKAYELNRDASTANLIGRIYYDQGKYDQALVYFKDSSNAGNQHGSFNAGLIYQSGLGTTPKNLAEAERYYRKAIEQVPRGQAFPVAHYQLAKVYQTLHESEKSKTNNYYGRKSNLELSKEQYKIAADNGHELAAFELAKIHQVEKNDKDAEIYFKKADDKGHSESQIRLWELYKAQNRKPEADAYLNKCAASGNPQAMYELGCQHEAQENYDQAFKYFYMANKKGHALAKEKLTDKKTRLSGYFSLYERLEEDKDAFETVFKAMLPYLALQKTLGYYFLNSEFLLNALDRTIDPDIKEAPFQKLEFLGDGVLTTSIREYFFDKNPKDWRVGDFEYATQSLLANKTVLPEVAKQLKLESLINLDETEGSHSVTDKMQADALEALIGAIFQDYGFSKTTNSTSYYMKARTIVQNLWKPWLERALQEKPRSAAAQKEKGPAPVLAVAHPSPTPAMSKEDSARPLSPATQRVFSATNGTVSADKFSKVVAKMSNPNNRNIGKKGDTALITLLRADELRPDNEVPKIKTLLQYGALWTATNHKGESAEDLLKKKHPGMAPTFGKP